MYRSKIIILIIFILALVGLGITQHFLSFRSVTITVKGPAVALTQNNKTIQTISSTTTLPLQDGIYCMTPENKDYTADQVCFTVYKKDMTVTSNPDYSKDHLAELQVVEQTIITNAIKNEYPTIISNYTVCTGSLIKKGEWYIATVMQKTLTASDNNDLYKTVLKKVDGVWKIVAKPSIVLSTFTYPDVPHAILSLANKQGGCTPDGYLSQPLPDDSIYPEPLKFD